MFVRKNLLSKDNIEKLKVEKYQFIIGARIKNESGLVKAVMLKSGNYTLTNKKLPSL